MVSLAQQDFLEGAEGLEVSGKEEDREVGFATSGATALDTAH